MIAANSLERFPIDVNQATEHELLRVPGLGPTAAQRILRQRREHTITRSQELQTMGVVLKRALPFLRFPGHKPTPAKQGEMRLFDEPAQDNATDLTPSRRTVDLHASHGPSGCASCPLNPGTCGMPAPSAPATMG